MLFFLITLLLDTFMVVIIKAILRMLPVFLLLILFLFVSKSCQQSACEYRQIYCD